MHELYVGGCQMAVEMIIDRWNPSKRRYRTEAFCYGPSFLGLSLPLRAGAQIPGRAGMTHYSGGVTMGYVLSNAVGILAY